ncbi:MAG: helix-turn-helix domain-containing protein [Terricaulis sp.]
MTDIIAKTRKIDGRLVTVRVHPDGREEVVSGGVVRPMTKDEIEAAAMADPDAQPLTPEQLARTRPTPRAKIIRRALGLTQEEFSARYHIPLGTLRDWEQGRAQPDQPNRAYLKVIAHDPDGVRKSLQKSRG